MSASARDIGIVRKRANHTILWGSDIRKKLETELRTDPSFENLLRLHEKYRAIVLDDKTPDMSLMLDGKFNGGGFNEILTAHLLSQNQKPETLGGIKLRLFQNDFEHRVEYYFQDESSLKEPIGSLIRATGWDRFPKNARTKDILHLFLYALTAGADPVMHLPFSDNKVPAAGQFSSISWNEKTDAFDFSHHEIVFLPPLRDQFVTEVNAGKALGGGWL